MQISNSLIAYYKYLKKILSKKRFKHSILVMKIMEQMAGIYNLDIIKAQTAGLVHDISKEKKLEYFLELMNNGNINYYDKMYRQEF